MDMMKTQFYYNELKGTFNHDEKLKGTSLTFSDCIVFGNDSDFLNDYLTFVEKVFIAQFKKDNKEYEIDYHTISVQSYHMQVCISANYNGDNCFFNDYNLHVTYEILSYDNLRFISNILRSEKVLIEYLFNDLLSINHLDEEDFLIIINSLPNVFNEVKKFKGGYIVECENGYTYYKRF